MQVSKTLPRRRETDTAVHDKTAFYEKLPRMLYAIGQFTENWDETVALEKRERLSG